MNDSSVAILLSLAALIIGVGIGFLFGSIQDAALRHNRKLKESGKLSSGWAVMPGSFGRVALLMIILVVIQLCCPLIFKGNIQWMVSAGVILGYGITLLKQLRQLSTYRPWND